MANNTIERPNFESSLQKIEEFSNSIATIPAKRHFKTDGGLFKLGEHYVNGTEMNSYVASVQKAFINQNSMITKIIREFKDVYDTFSYLDKEYLGGIMMSLQAAEEAGKGARIAGEKAGEAALRALKNEEDIKKEIEAVRTIVEKLREFKADFSSGLKSLEAAVSQNARHIDALSLSSAEAKKDADGMKAAISSLEQALRESQKKQKRNTAISIFIASMAAIFAIISFFL